MTENRNSKIKSRILIFLTVICLIMTSCFLFTACGSSEESSSDTTSYSYTEENTEPVSNADFSYGTYNKKLSDFPVTSPTGWSRAADNGATTSTVNSGVIDTGDAAFAELISTLCGDSDFINYLKNKHGVTEEDIKDAVKAEKGEDYTPTDEDVTTYIKDNYAVDFVNPKVYEGADDDFVYMMNNYAKNDHYGFGTAQRITSASTVTVVKGGTYKISVWVKTLLLSKGGANIRITNSINGNSQAQFKISNITDTEWTNYVVYFKADANYSSTFTIVLGLGYGNGSSSEGVDFAEGTVFFDGVTVEEIEDYEAEISGKAVNDAQAFVLGGEDSPEYVMNGEQAERTVYYLYDMSIAGGVATYFDDVAFSGDFGYTVSNVTENNENITSKTMVGDESTVSAAIDGNDVTLTLNRASGTLRVNGGEEFTVDANGYSIVTFLVSNRLKTLGSTDITVDVFDVNGETTEKRAAVATFSSVNEEDEFTSATIVLKNNFEDGERKFRLEIVVGPTDLNQVKSAQAFASGTVILKDLKIMSGTLEHDEENAEHKLYHFFSDGANATQSLYAGYSSDYSEQTNTETYSLSPASGNVGTITHDPSPVSGYFGIVANHTYLKEETGDGELETAVNTRTDFDGEDGYAGLINTKYIDDYTDANLVENLGDAFNGTDNIQPIVIYNKNADHYGFIGSSKNVAASAYAKIAVKVRVTGDAKAYIYIVDTSKADKEVMEFADFTLNGETVKAEDHKLQKVISAAEMADATDGFITVNFYIANGAAAKNFRVEVWNGGRDGEDATASQGYVFINAISITLSSAFSEPSNAASAFSKSGNPLYEIGKDNLTLISYTRELTETEISFNAEYPDKAVSYSPKYIWAESATDVYAVYNTVDPVVTDPYDSIVDDEDEGSGCTANTDSSTFWLSFSSILLASALIVAVIALVVKNLRRKRIANKSDARSHYKVSSRTTAQKTIKAEKEKQTAQKKAAEKVEAEPAEETVKEPAEEIPEAEETPSDAENSDAYVYGEVQDFGEDDKGAEETSDKEDKPE